MFDQVISNKRKSIALIAAFVLLIIGVGAAISYVLSFGWVGLLIALPIAAIGAITSYYNSDKVALALAGARAADTAEFAQLNNLVESMAIAAGLPKPAVYVVDDPAPNAFATGRNPEHAAIAVTTGLLQIMSRVELEGVIAHEMSHIKNYDILVGTIAVICVGVVVIGTDIAARMLWFRDSDRTGGNPIFMVIGILTIILAPIAAMAMKAAISRRREMLADFSGVELTRYPPGLIGALEKLKNDKAVVRHHSNAIAHLYIESPSDTRKSWLNRLFETHPPIDERIAALRSM